MTVSLFDRIGGQPAVATAVDALYRAILGDPRLAGYFKDVDVALLKRHMVALLSQVLGGPEDYRGRALRAAHAGLGITGAGYDLVGAYLIGILATLGADDEVLTAVRGVLRSTEDDVVQ
jgi:hemoglobin